MKKGFTGFLAILLAVSFIFIFTGCGKTGNVTTTAAATTAAGETTTAAGETTTAAVTTTAAGETTTAAGVTTTAAVTTVAGQTTTVVPTTKPSTTKPVTVAQIVAYYNAASNKAKIDKPGFTLVTTNIIGKITSPSSVIQGLAGTVVGMFNTKPTTTTTAKGSNGDLPVQGQSYGSKLVPSSLKSASCVDKGTYYAITLNFKDEKLSALPVDPLKTNHGQALNVLSASDISVQTDKFKSLVTIQEFAPTYSGSYISCTIDKATGNLKTATYYLNTIATVKAKVLFSTMSATVPFGIKNEYTLKY